MRPVLPPLESQTRQVVRILRESPMLTAAAGQTLPTGTRSPRLPSHARLARSTKPGAASRSTGHAAFPRGRCLLLGLLAMAHAASATVFATKTGELSTPVVPSAVEYGAERVLVPEGGRAVPAVSRTSNAVEQLAATNTEFHEFDSSTLATPQPLPTPPSRPLPLTLPPPPLLLPLPPSLSEPTRPSDGERRLYESGSWISGKLDDLPAGWVDSYFDLEQEYDGGCGNGETGLTAAEKGLHSKALRFCGGLGDAFAFNYKYNWCHTAELLKCKRYSKRTGSYMDLAILEGISASEEGCQWDWGNTHIDGVRHWCIMVNKDNARYLPPPTPPPPSPPPPTPPPPLQRVANIAALR